MVGITSYGAYIPMLRLPLGAIAGGGRKADGRQRREGGRQLRRGQRHHGGGRRDELPRRHRPRQRRRRAVRLDVVRLQGEAGARASSPRRSTCAATWSPPTSPTRCAPARRRCAPALDAVKAGSARNVLVVASDCRLAAPRSALERNFGDGAAAFLIGDDDVAADVRAPPLHRRRDHRRLAHRRRAVRAHVGRSLRRRARLHATTWSRRCKGLLQKAGLTPKDFTKAVLYGPDARSHAGVARAARLRRQDAGAGSAVRQARQHRRRVRADAAGRRARETPSRAASCCSPTTATAPKPSRIAVTDAIDRAAPQARHAAGICERRAELERLRQVSRLPQPAAVRGRPPRRPGRVGDRALPRPRRGHQLPRPQVPHAAAPCSSRFSASASSASPRTTSTRCGSRTATAR